MFLSSCRARRRHWQWMCWLVLLDYDTPRAMFPSIVDVRGDSTGAVLGEVVHAPVVKLRQVPGVGQCRRTVEVPQLQSVQFLDVLTRPLFL